MDVRTIHALKISFLIHNSFIIKHIHVNLPIKASSATGDLNDKFFASKKHALWQIGRRLNV
ncbi:MAG: hypothetical protein EAZ42_06265 [Verrucomicrobia bacterium]|nr:MAG: hypothetical protein EAZ42_06265 [Verrucomicrobiota bacterium]